MNKHRIILLVEDEALIALTETWALENEGYTVIHAANGLEAMEIMRSGEYPVDLILMDIDLGPGIDGTDTAREIVQYHDVPVVFLSSHAEKHIVEKTEAITSFGYILKDAGDVVLLASVKMAFRLHEAYRSLEESDSIARASEHRYRDIFNSVVEGVFRTSVEGKFMYINPSGAKMLGYDSPEDLVGQVADITDQIYVNPGDRDRLKETLVERGLVENFEIELRRRGGDSIWVSLNATADFDAGGKFTHLTCTILDITGEKRVVEELKASEERYRALLQASFGAIVISENGIVLDANENASLMSGYSRDEMIGMSIERFTTEETHDRMMRHFDAWPEEPFEMIGVRRDGGRYIAELQLRKFTCRGRQVMAIAIRDVTEREKILVRNYLQSVELASAKRKLQNIVGELEKVCLERVMPPGKLA